MSKIISIHSFRGGTGKSNTAANVAVLLAAEGRRVGVVDTDIQSPGIHILFGLAGEQISHALNDYLWGKCEIAATAHDVTSRLGADLKGRVFLIPSSIRPGEITRVLREGYDAQLLTKGFRRLMDELGLDVLLIDTHPGLGEETLLSIVISHTLAIILRPDQQDYEGTGVTVQVARKLKVPNMVLLVNKVPAVFDTAAVKAQVEQAYGCPVVAILPHSDELMALASGGIFALRYPDHPVTALFKEVASRLVELAPDSPRNQAATD
jgi:septum site-determining protein MinD